MNRIEKLVLHEPAPFHADDMMVAAMVKMLYPSVKIVFAKRDDIIVADDETLVADIGFGKYDHHQKNAETHATDDTLAERFGQETAAIFAEANDWFRPIDLPENRKYAACTLVYRELMDKLFSNREMKVLFLKLLFLIERTDNTGKFSFMARVIKSFNYMWDETEIPYYDLKFKYCLTNIALPFMRYAINCDENYSEFEAMRNEDINIHAYINMVRNYFNPILFGCNADMLVSLPEMVWPETIKFINDFDNIALSIIKFNNSGYCPFLTCLFARMVATDAANKRAVSYVKTIARESGKVMVLNKGLPWREAVRGTDVILAITPRNDGGVNLSSAYDWTGEKPVPIITFDESVYKYEGCTFVHHNGYLATFDTAEHARIAAENIIK